MSLKFTAMGRLPILSALGTPPRADDQVQDLGPAGPHEPITTVGRRGNAAELEKPEAEGRVINVDYVLEARKGQHMNVSMATNNGANYFNILAPGENEVAMFNGSIGENQFEGILPKSGAYKVRVHMMRSAARRNEVAKYRLEMVISGAADKPSTAGGKSSGGHTLVKGTNPT